MSSTRFDFDSFNEFIANNEWSRKSVSLFHLNARSFRNKGEQRDVYFEQLSLKFDFLCFTETWYADAGDVYLFLMAIPMSGCLELKSEVVVFPFMPKLG